MNDTTGQTGEWKAVVVRMPVTHIIRFRVKLLLVLTPCVLALAVLGFLEFRSWSTATQFMAIVMGALFTRWIVTSWRNLIVLAKLRRSQVQEARRMRALTSTEHPVLAAEVFAEQARWSPKSFERLRFEDAKRDIVSAGLPNVWLDETAALYIGHPNHVFARAPKDGSVGLQRTRPLGWSRHLWAVAVLAAFPASVLIVSIVLEPSLMSDFEVVLWTIAWLFALFTSSALFAWSCASRLVITEGRPSLRRWGRPDVAISPANTFISITGSSDASGKIWSIQMTLAVSGRGVFRVPRVHVISWAWCERVVEAATAWTAGSTRLRCIPCGYSLVGLPAQTPCPECGAARDFLPAGLAAEGGPDPETSMGSKAAPDEKS